ncbi:MAG: alpha/beta fold hydrolase, partial [Thermoguttaceae bacterium]
FMHWAVSAILHWTPTPLETTPTFQIHGALDRVIPLKSVAPEKIIADGGHLINITHAQSVNEYIREVVDRTSNP